MTDPTARETPDLRAALERIVQALNDPTGGCAEVVEHAHALARLALATPEPAPSLDDEALATAAANSGHVAAPAPADEPGVTTGKDFDETAVLVAGLSDDGAKGRDLGHGSNTSYPLVSAGYRPTPEPAPAVLDLPGHKCRPVARVPANILMDGRELWLGELTESYPGFEHETHCLHVTTPQKSVVFGVYRGDFDLLAVLGSIVGSRPVNGRWVDRMVEVFRDAALTATPSEAKP